MTAKNLGFVYELFIKNSELKHTPRSLKLLETGLRLYVLPAYGFTNVTEKRLVESLSQISVQNFLDAPEKLKQRVKELVEAGQISEATIRNYTTPINRFTDWLRAQIQFLPAGQQLLSERKPAKEDIRNKGKKHYGLNLKKLMSQTKVQLNQFESFCTTPSLSARPFKAITPGGMQHRKQNISRFFGWLIAEKKLSIEQLDLNLMVNLDLVREYIDWSCKTRNSSPSWALDILKVSEMVVVWSYHGKVADFNSLEEIKQLQSHKKNFYRPPLRGKGKSKQRYGLRRRNLPAKLLQQFLDLQHFSTAIFVKGRSCKRIVERTYQNYEDSILCFLGWMRDYHGFNLEDLGIELITDADKLIEYLQWGIEKNGKSYNWGLLGVCSAQRVARYLAHIQEIDYEDYSVAIALKKLLSNAIIPGVKREREQTVDRKKQLSKSISIEDIDRVIEELEQDCSPLNQVGKPRPEAEIIRAKLRHLVVKFLRFCPIRQRELREMKISGNLSREPHPTIPNFHCYVMHVRADEQKSGPKTNKGREFRLPDVLTLDMDDWLQNWRSKLNLDHEFVFFSIGRGKYCFGHPIKTTSTIWYVVGKATSEVLGEWLGPHDFRHLAITWQRTHGARSQDKGFAEIMGHTPEAAEKFYSHVTSRDKAEPAVDWHKRALANPTVRADSQNHRKLTIDAEKLISILTPEQKRQLNLI